jgi:hypothetical protein
LKKTEKLSHGKTMTKTVIPEIRFLQGGHPKNNTHTPVSISASRDHQQEELHPCNSFRGMELGTAAWRKRRTSKRYLYGYCFQKSKSRRVTLKKTDEKTNAKSQGSGVRHRRSGAGSGTGWCY